VSRLPYQRYDQLSPEARQVWDDIVGTRGDQLMTAEGGLVGPFNAFVTAPGVGRHLSSLGATVRFGSSIERRLSELAIITVGARWQAEFEWWAHVAMARRHGVPESVIEAIAAGEQPVFEAEDERIVYAAASQLVTTGRLGSAEFDAARALLGDAGVVELVTLSGYYTLISFLLNAFDVPLPPDAAPRWPQP
jgi:4-carboxymuconolactone decarboxylase